MAKKAKHISPPKTIGVKKIRTDDLEPNPHNPRLLFDTRPLGILQNSIRKVGILVPLTVYQDSKTRKYVILDGQRRWICAQKIGLETVPANEIEEPDEVENIVTMFQIHKFREDWELMPTALKLEVLMKKLEEQSDRILAELTGLDVAVVSRCKKLLKFPPRYQEMMLFIDPKDRIKADFFIELYPIISDVAVREMRRAVQRSLHGVSPKCHRGRENHGDGKIWDSNRGFYLNLWRATEEEDGCHGKSLFPLA